MSAMPPLAFGISSARKLRDTTAKETKKEISCQNHHNH